MIAMDARAREDEPPAATLQWGAIVLLALAVGSASFARLALGPLQETLKASLSLSDNEIALVQGPALAAPLLLAAIPIGMAVDRFVRVRLLVLSAGLGVAGTLASALAPDLTTLLIARAVVGLAAAATPVIVFSLMGELVPVQWRGRAMTLLTMGEVGGSALAFAFGGAALSVSLPTLSDWRAALLCAAALLTAPLLCLLLLREPKRSTRHGRGASIQASIATLWRHRGMFAALLVGKIMVGVVVGALIIWSAPTFTRRFGASPAEAGAMVSLVLLVSGIVGPLAGGIAADLCQRRGGPRRTITLLALLALLGVVSAFFPLAPSLTFAVALLFAFKTLASTIAVMETTLITIVFPTEVRGFAAALLIAATTVFGVGAAPLFVSLISGAIGGEHRIGEALAIVCGGGALIAATTFVIARPAFAADAPS